MSRWGAPWWSVLVALVAATALGTTPVAAHADPDGEAEGEASGAGGDGPSRVLPDDDVDGHPAEAYEIWYADDGWDVGIGENDDTFPCPHGQADPRADADGECPLPTEPFFGSAAEVQVEQQTSVTDRMTGWVTDGLFALARSVLLAGSTLVTWAYSFELAGRLAEPAAELAGALDARLLGPLEARHLAMLATVVYAGWQLLRHRLAHGLGELGLTLVVVAAAGWLLADAEGAFRRGVGVTAGLSAAVVELATPPDGDTAADGDAYAADGYAADTSAAAGFTDTLAHAFIAQPHMLLNWGRPLAGDCAEAHDELLASGPHGTSDRVRDDMADAGCEQAAEWNAQPTWQRLLGAGLVVAAGAVVVGLVVLVAATVVVGQLVAVALVGLMPVAVVGGMLPGGGRQLLWRWVTAALKTALVVVAMAALLTFLLIGAEALLAAPADSLVERFALLAAAPIAAVVMRRKLLSAATTAATQFGGRLERRRTGGTHGGGWMRPAAAGGLSGLGAAQMARDGQADAGELRRHAHTARQRGRQAAHTAQRPFRATGGSAGGGGPAGGGRGGGRSPAGRAAAAVGKTTKTAAKATVGLPVAGPAAAAKTAHKTAAVRARLDRAGQRGQAYTRQWRAGVAHPVRQYQRERADLARKGQP